MCMEMGFQNKYFSKGEMGDMVWRGSLGIGRSVHISDYTQKDISIREQEVDFLLNCSCNYSTYSRESKLTVASFPIIALHRLYTLSCHDFSLPNLLRV